MGASSKSGFAGTKASRVAAGQESRDRRVIRPHATAAETGGGNTAKEHNSSRVGGPPRAHRSGSLPTRQDKQQRLSHTQPLDGQRVS